MSLSLPASFLLPTPLYLPQPILCSLPAVVRCMDLGCIVHGTLRMCRYGTVVGGVQDPDMGPNATLPVLEWWVIGCCRPDPSTYVSPTHCIPYISQLSVKEKLQCASDRPIDPLIPDHNPVLSATHVCSVLSQHI